MEYEDRWVLKYSPKRLEDCILPERMKEPIQRITEAEYIPHLFLWGAPGVGKTLLVTVLADTLGYEVFRLNGSSEVTQDSLRGEVLTFCSTYSMTGEPKLCFFDEADGIPQKAQETLRGMIEKYQGNVSFVFTGNYPHKLLDPIKSRLTKLEIGGLGSEKINEELRVAVRERLRQICDEENLKPNDNQLDGLVDAYFPDIRRIISRAELELKFGLSGSFIS